MKQNNLTRKLLAPAVAIALTASLTACGGNTAPTAPSTEKPAESTAFGTILLSVNPEIEVEYDDKGIVVEIEGINDDGKTVVTGYESFQGRACAEVVEELVEKIYEGGYFEKQVDGHAKNIVVKLENGSNCPDGDFLEEVADGVRKAVSACGVTSAAMVVDEDDLDDQGRIGTEKARELALAQLGLSQADFSQGEYELDDGVYELEFTANGVEYEYEVDAVTGKVLEADREHNDDWDAWEVDDDANDDDDDDRSVTIPVSDDDDDLDDRGDQDDLDDDNDLDDDDDLDDNDLDDDDNDDLDDRKDQDDDRDDDNDDQDDDQDDSSDDDDDDNDD